MLEGPLELFAVAFGRFDLLGSGYFRRNMSHALPVSVERQSPLLPQFLCNLLDVRQSLIADEQTIQILHASCPICVQGSQNAREEGKQFSSASSHYSFIVLRAGVIFGNEVVTKRSPLERARRHKQTRWMIWRLLQANIFSEISR